MPMINNYIGKGIQECPKGPKIAPREPQEGPGSRQEGPKGPKIAPRVPPEGPRSRQEGPKKAQDRAKSAPRKPKIATRRPKVPRRSWVRTPARQFGSSRASLGGGRGKKRRPNSKVEIVRPATLLKVSGRLGRHFFPRRALNLPRAFLSTFEASVDPHG